MDEEIFDSEDISFDVGFKLITIRIDNEYPNDPEIDLNGIPPHQAQRIFLDAADLLSQVSTDPVITSNGEAVISRADIIQEIFGFGSFFMGDEDENDEDY